nr:MAG: polyprotein [Hanko iflavirus 1]
MNSTTPNTNASQSVQTTFSRKHTKSSKRPRYFVLENIINNKFFSRPQGVPSVPPVKNSFAYFVERGTRFIGDRISTSATYVYPARCIYNEMSMVLPEFREFSLNFQLRERDHSNHQVQLIVPAFDPNYVFEGEHTKLSMAEDMAFRVFFLHSCVIRAADALQASTGETVGVPLPYYQPVPLIEPEQKLDINTNELPSEVLPNELLSGILSDLSVNFQSGLTGMVGEAKASPETTEDSQLVSVQDVEIVQSYPAPEPERILSEETFTDLNLAGVEWWLARYTWNPLSTITTFDLYEMLFSTVNSNAAIMKSFQVHAISNLKARIIIKPTANKFNVGLLGVTFVPLWKFWSTADQLAWKNKYTLSQLPHSIINACSNNEVQVDVNFSYPLEFMPHVSSPNYLSYRTLGSLMLFPISPLTIGDQGTKNCDLNIFIHFESVQFGGKIDQRINMQSGLLGIVSKGIHAASSLANGNPDPLFHSLNAAAKSFINNGNADHPVNPSPGTFFIPQFLPSQSSVTNIENPVNSFRLDPMGVVTHDYPPVESFQDIVRSPGLFRQVTVQSTDSPKLLTHWCNQPLKPSADYVRSEYDSNRRYVPPLGVVSSMFENYKGSIVYDILVAMTDKHNIKLMFGVLPTPIDPAETVDLTYLRNSKFTELNFTDGNFSASVTAPYFNPKCWSRIPSNGSINADCTSAAYTPSYCYLFTISTLSYSVGVASSIQLSIFERAGDDFELSVYKSPSISVAPYSPPLAYPILTLQGYHWSHDLTFTASSLAPSGKPASADSIWNMWFDNPTSSRAFAVFFGDTPTSGPPVPGYGNRRYGVAYVPLGYNDASAVIVSMLDSTAAPLPAVYNAIAAYASQYNATSLNTLGAFFTSAELTTSFVYGSSSNFFHVRWTPGLPIPVTEPISSNAIEKNPSDSSSSSQGSSSSKSNVNMQSGLTGNIGNIPSKPSPFNSTSNRAWGKKDFGEDFSSITNLMKRPYGDINVNIDTSRSANFPNAALRVNVTPAIPYTIPPPINSIEYDAATSAAEIVLKAFIGFKGSIILHTLFPSTPNANVWTNYFPDAYPQNDISQYPTYSANQRLISTAPKQVFNLGINSAVRTAVPYYSPSRFVFTWVPQLTQTGDNAVVSSLGSVVYGLDVNQVSSVPLTMRTVVMRSFGDDAALYLFRGFPPVVFLNENSPPVLARDSTKADIEENPGPPSFSRFVHNVTESAGHGLSTGLLSGVENYFSDLASSLETTIANRLSAMGISSTPDFSLSNILTVLVQESGHCFINPKWKTFLWSFAIVLNRLGLVGVNCIPKIASCLSLWFQKIAAVSYKPTQDTVVLQGPEEEDPHPSEFITILITGVATLFNVKEWKDDKNRTSKKFTETFRSALQLGTTLQAFMKATKNAFKSLFQTAYYWFISERPDAKTVLALSVTNSLVANWMKEVDFLTDRSNRESITSDPSIQLRVRVAYIVGRRLHMQLILTKDRRTSPMTYYFTQIKKLYEDFAENGFSHHIRKEPFVIYVHGKTCIGKSQMQSDLCSKLLAAENIAYDGPMVYTVPTISPFMSGLKKQPVIAVDDMMSVLIPESLRNWFTLVFENATCASFRPNMAAIEEKEKLVENEILYFNSNHEFINHDALPDKNAFHRRFHFKIEAELKEEYKIHETAKSIDIKILSKFGHLQFRRTLNPHNVLEPQYTAWMTYDELVQLAIKDFKEFRIAAQESVNRRMMCELQSKSLGLNNISYEDLQNESFVESKILEFLNTLDELDSDRGIFSFDFRKMLKPYSKTLSDTFKEYYPKVSTPLSSVLNRMKSWTHMTQTEPMTVETQGPTASTPVSSPSRSAEIINAHQLLNDLYNQVDPEYRDFVSSYFRPLNITDPVHAFVHAVRVAEILKLKHFSKCRCEVEALDTEFECEEKENCFVFLYKSKVSSNPPHISTSVSWFSAACDYVKTFLKNVWDSMATSLKCVLVFLGIVTTGSLVKLAFNWFISLWNGDKNQIDEDFKETFLQSGHYSPGNSSKETKKSSNVKRNVGAFTSKAVMLQSGNLTDVVSKTRRNLKWFTVCPVEEEFNTQFSRKLYPILGVQGRQYFVILHYINDIIQLLKDGNIVTLYDGQIHVPLSENDFHPSLFQWRYTDECLSELGIWNAPARINLVPNIIVHCGSRAKLNRMNNECYIVPCVPDMNSPCVLTRFNRSDARFYEDISKYNNLISYDDYSAPGFCGSLVFSKNLGTLVAIHTMGSSNGKLGFGELIFREDIEVENVIEPGYNSFDLEPCSSEEIGKFPQYLKMLGKIPDHQVKKQASTSVFSLSPLANTVFEVRKEPAPLVASDPRIDYKWSPMREGVKKHSNPPKGFDPVLLRVAAADTCDLLQQCCPPPRTNVSILNIEDAVIGIPELNFKPLDMSTSPGFPLNAIRKSSEKGKVFLFNIETINNERKLIGLHPSLKHILSVESSMRSSGTACFSPAIDCLKDELLKIEKARRVGGTRVFSVSPVQQVIAGKQLMGDWLIAYRSNWFRSEHGISINPLSNDWMCLAQRLSKFPHILEGDFSNFGPQADSGVALLAIENIISWYEFNNAPSDHLIQLHALKEELVNGIHICSNYVYSTISGIISGSFATAEINSEINKIYMRIAWMATTNTSLQVFSENVVLYTYGDDVIMSVSAKYIEKYNVRTISEFLGEHGIKFTNASKTTFITESVTLDEATFLKRGFRSDPSVPNQCLAPLDKVSIEEQINWVRNTQDPWDLITASTNSMMMEAAMWGQSYYDDIKKKLNKAFASKQHQYSFLNYHDMIQKIYYKDAPVTYPTLTLSEDGVDGVDQE